MKKKKKIDILIDSQQLKKIYIIIKFNCYLLGLFLLYINSNYLLLLKNSFTIYLFISKNKK